MTLGDAGTYQCLAKNEAGVAVARTKLVLQGKIDFSFCFSYTLLSQYAFEKYVYLLLFMANVTSYS